MIVELEKQVVKSNRDSKEVKFAPTEQGLLHLIDVVANKQYKNPIKSLMVEYVQNALDSHDIEIKNRIEKGEKNPKLPPIEITIPSEDHPFYEVRDFGISMSNSEIVSILTKIGLSMKNHSNDLRGGFGLGKLVFSSYNTKTMVISNYLNGERHDWVARLGGGEGGITPLGKVKCSEQKGLRIKVPVREDDISTFRSYSKELYNYITPEPKILNFDDHLFDRPSVEKEGDGWIITNGGREVIATMGGLCFPVEISQLNGLDFSNHLNNYYNRHGLVLHFGIGELDIVSSRDSLDYGPEKKTISAIKKRIEKIKEDFEKENKNFSTMNKFEKKDLVRELIKIRKKNNILSYFRGAFFESKEVKDFMEKYDRSIIMDDEIHHKQREIYYNSASSRYITRRSYNNCGHRFVISKEINWLPLYTEKIFTYVNSKLSVTKLRNILNNTVSGKESWNSDGEKYGVVITKTQKEMEDFLDKHAISKNVTVDVNEFEKEYIKTSSSKRKDTSSDSTPHKVYTMRSYSSGGAYSFINVDFSDEKFEDTDKYIWASFNRYEVDFDGFHDAGRELGSLVDMAQQLGIIKERPIPLCFNKIAQRKYKPENTYTHANDYAKELKKKISQKIERKTNIIYESCISKAYSEILDYRFKRYFNNINSKDLKDSNLKYIVKVHNEVNSNDPSKYAGIYQHSSFKKINDYAVNFVRNILTSLNILDYDDYVNKLVEKELKTITIR